LKTDPPQRFRHNQNGINTVPKSKNAPLLPEIKGINTAGQALHPPPAAASAASRRVLNPSFPHSLNHARASTVAISLRSSIKPGKQ
jgi:hypothetical protein